MEKSKIDINEIFEEEINNFNFCWKSLNETKKILEHYSKFFQKYLDIINTYYMSLTELKASFPKYLFSSCEDEIDNPMKKISQLFISFIENQLNNLLNFLSNTQSILFSLNQSISISDNILNKSKEKNENIFSSIKTLIDKYNNEYLLMINSFENLENKIVKNYIKNVYNQEEKNACNSGDEENIIKNCASISKKLEDSFLNFKKDDLRQFLYEYNNNINEITNSNNQNNKEFLNYIIHIINSFNEYYNNSINSINNELSDIKDDYSNINLNENECNYILKEKEISSIIYNVFNSKKYNIKILINNEIINDEQPDTKKKKIDLRKKSKLFLSEKDKYNIIKEIYNYDFKSINKEEYNLELEKEKIKIYDLLQKLFSYDLIKDIKETITEEEVKTLSNLVKVDNNNNQNMIYFLFELSHLRSEGKFEMPIRAFDIINIILQNCLEEISDDNDKYTKIISSIIMNASTFYVIKENKKYYLKEEIKNHKIFKSIEFWKDYTIMQISEDIKMVENDKNMVNEEMIKKKMNDIIYSKIFVSIVTMGNFGVDKNSIFNIIDFLMSQYQIDEKKKESFLSVINQQK